MLSLSLHIGDRQAGTNEITKHGGDNQPNSSLLSKALTICNCDGLLVAHLIWAQRKSPQNLDVDRISIPAYRSSLIRLL